MKIGKFVLGLGLGVAAGLLLAPKKGSELRKDVKDESLKAYHSVKNMTKEDVEVVIGTTIETVKKTIDEFDIDEFKDVTKNKLTELEEKLEVFASKVKELDNYSQIVDNVVDISEKVNTKIEEVKTKVFDTTLESKDIEDWKHEIDAVEEKLDEMIEEIED